ncbi:MAG: 6-phosphogluconolactonase [Candidatus Omnitrophica bacterium]|nr:6-phosphogluconolactonase [Candidatus Omnitrophota bacterium]
MAPARFWRMKPEICVASNLTTLSRKASKIIFRVIRDSFRHKGFATVVLAGGSTPETLYRILVRKKSEIQSKIWERVYFFFGDERAVPPQSRFSNYRMAQGAMLRHLPVPPRNIFRVRSELGAAKAARDYEKRLRGFFKKDPFPRFDLVLLGLGEDGHTASLFPGSPALKEKKRWVLSTRVSSVKPPARITLTLPVLNSAENVMFLVSGSNKAWTAERILNRKEELPARKIQPRSGRLIWMLDHEAARFLKRRL